MAPGLRMPQLGIVIYVLAYPVFERPIAESIARFRRRHEPERARLVPAHVTLVFGTGTARPPDVIAQCQEAAEAVAEIDVEFTEGQIVYDPFEKTYKLSLLSAAGTDALIRLHERLHAGSLRAELRPDIPYRPHMTVATHEDRAAIERVDAAAIGRFPISGKIGSLDVVKRAGDTLNSLKTIPLRK